MVSARHEKHCEKSYMMELVDVRLRQLKGEVVEVRGLKGRENR